MRKEVLWAIIFGAIMGGIILFGIKLANQSVTDLNSTSSAVTKPETTPTSIPSSKSLEIRFPQNHTVLTEKTTTLTGKAAPLSNLAIITELDDLILQASPEGTFSAQINLVAGENTLTVTSLLKDNTTETQTITIIQSNSITE